VLPDAISGQALESITWRGSAGGASRGPSCPSASSPSTCSSAQADAARSAG